MDVFVPACSQIPTPSLYFIAATILLALLGGAMQLVGGSLMRGGSPSALDPGIPGSVYSDVRISWILEVFEKQLVSDAGSTLNNFGTLVAVVAVVASITIGFPNWSVVGTLVTATFFLFPLVALCHGFQQMTRKRDRMQNLFDTLPPTDPNERILASGRGGFEIRGPRDYWVDRHPSLGTWRAATALQRVGLLLKQIYSSAKLYFPFERA